MKLDTNRLAAACTTVDGILAKMPGRHAGWKTWLTGAAKDAATVDALMTKIRAGEADGNFALALLVREACASAPKVVRGLADVPTVTTEIGAFHVHHGDLVIGGDLPLVEHLLVTGDLTVDGVIVPQREWRTLLVGGSLVARGASFGNDFVRVAGALRIGEALTIAEGDGAVGGTLVAPLVIEWLGGVAANTTAIPHRFTSDEVMEYGRASRAKLEALLDGALFDPADDDDDVMAVVGRLVERMRAKQPIWRTAGDTNAADDARATKPAATTKARGRPKATAVNAEVIPKRLAEALKKTNAEVDLSGMRLPAIPAAIGDLRKVKTLRLGHNALTALPPEIGALTTLRELWLDENRLRVLPAELGALAQLTTLIACKNALTDLPPSVAKLAALQTLNLDDNRFTAIPASVYALRALVRLSLMNCPLATLDDALGKLKGLESLTVGARAARDQRLTALPDVFGKLTNLHTFELYGAKLERVPPSLAKAKALRNLRLQDAGLTTVPKEIVRLAALEELHLAENPITELPSLEGLVGLKTLSLTKTKLTAIPEAVFRLPKLDAIYAEGCRIPKRDWENLREVARRQKVDLYLS